MQGKDASEQETKVKSSVGIDVSKHWLDVHVLPCEERLRVSNTVEGIRKLKRWLKRFELTCILVEATGKWHRAVQRSLFAAGLPITAVDPFRVRMFAKAQGLFAKTDRLDARVLAQFAAIMDPTIRPPAPEAIEALQELVRARDSTVAEETALKNQLAAARDRFLVRQLKRRLERIGKDIAALERETLKRIKADAGLARRHAILTSMPGVGDVVAVSLIACLSELGALSAKQIALLAGLAPIADDSGERQGVRVIWGGRSAVRRVLYLAALSAARHSTDLKVFYRRLIGNGKTPKRALIAVARKIVVLANTLIAQDRTWQPQPPQHA
jgi:transposase